MKFDKEDIDLVQAHTWTCHNKGYVQCTTKKPGMISSLFHVCVRGKTDKDHHIVHLNKEKNDNRRANIPVVGKKRKRGE